MTIPEIPIPSEPYHYITVTVLVTRMNSVTIVVAISGDAQSSLWSAARRSRRRGSRGSGSGGG